MPSLRSTALLPFSFATLLTPLACQTAQHAAAPHVPAPAPKDPRLQGLPPCLLIVPGGTVQVGLTAEDLVRVVCETVSPSKPQIAAKIAEKKVAETLRLSARTLGREKVQVDTFLLAKWPVKNAEYEVYVKHLRAVGKKVRAPFHWWRYGRKDDYDQKLEAINKQFPRDREGPVKFWEQNGHELPYKLVDERGQSIADQPVSYVSYSEAVSFAGWLGMRLATEAEWTRAARGDGTHVWAWGLSQLGDKYTGEAVLKHMRLYASADQKPLEAGSVEAAIGPYGHVDMFGRIWQLVSGVGFRAINGVDPFAKEWQLLQKDKVGALLQVPPVWEDNRVLAKGGSFLSGGDPAQLLIDSRARLRTDDVLEGAGIRLAKSLQPGYDMLFSLVRGVYNRAPFAADQDVELAGQVGAERYDLDATGFPTAYRAVSLAPMNWLSSDKGADLTRLLANTHATPLLIGTLATTEKLLNPEVPPGIYSVLYRTQGMPRELADAIKAGYREVQAGLKGKAKPDAEPKPDEAKPEEGKDDKGKDDKGKDDKAKKKTDWRTVIARYGITPKDLEPKEAAHGLDFVRIDEVVVSTVTDCFLLHGNDGKVVAAIPATNHQPKLGRGFVPGLTFLAGPKDKAIARFHFATPLLQTDKNRVVEFRLNLEVDCAPPTPAAPWRLAAPPGAEAAPAANAAATSKDQPKENGDGGTGGSAKVEKKK